MLQARQTDLNQGQMNSLTVMFFDLTKGTQFLPQPGRDKLFGGDWKGAVDRASLGQIADIVFVWE